jgi:F0F1-type ATP synthase assembly protein I
MANDVTKPKTETIISENKAALPEVKNIHAQADSLLKSYVEEFENELRLQANILAKDDEIILSSHVKESLSIVQRKKERKWSQELLILFGGGLFGTFLAGFLNELAHASPRPLWIAVYVFLGFAGAILIFIGFIKQYER